MVRTGARAGVLENLLVQGGAGRSSKLIPPPRLEGLTPELAAEIVNLYKVLGAAAPSDSSLPFLRPGAWDISLADGLVVELDEELHFNRYRGITLQGAWALALPWRSEYLEMCSRYESRCLAAGRWGKRWTNPSCDAMFGGGGDEPGRFGSGGAPRWKQRALYDALKDAAALRGIGVALARVAVHDEMEGVRLGDILDGSARSDPPAMVRFVKQRTTEVIRPP
jgi:hypothetical protein